MQFVRESAVKGAAGISFPGVLAADTPGAARGNVVVRLARGGEVSTSGSRRLRDSTLRRCAASLPVSLERVAPWVMTAQRCWKGERGLPRAPVLF